MKKVLYITDYVDIGGGESSLINLMHYFKINNVLEPILLIPQEGKLTKLCDDLSIKYIVSSFGYFTRAWLKFLPLINPMTIYRLILIFKREKIDLIHINSNSHGLVNSLIPSLLLGIPTIWTCHGWWEKPFGLRAKVLNIFLDKVFVVSDYVKKFVEFPPSKVVTTYLGIDQSKFDWNKQDRNEVLELNLEEDNIIIGMIGRYQPVKNQKLFVEVADEILLNEEYNNCIFIIVGDTSFRDNYKEYKTEVFNLINTSKNKGKIKTYGFEFKIEKFYDVIDVLVVPSLFESFSMVTLEGMAKGLKVVATDVGGPSELIEDGKNGFLFQSENKNELIVKIKEAIESSDQINTEATNRAQKFSIYNIARTIICEYENIWGMKK
jgi:glycosyltransferase involved in cell wall biosynthesis